MTVALPPSVRLVDGPSGLPLLHITNEHATAEVFLDGAQICGYAPAGHRDVLFVSRDTRFEAGRPLRGGIPLCAPWFGPGVDGNRKPAHGFFRNVRWELSQAHDDGDTTTVTLTLPPAALTELPAAADWPADARAQLRVRVGPELAVELTVTAGAGELEVEVALHTYLSVADVRRVRLDGLAGAGYLDKLDGRTRTQDGELVLTGQTDRVYHCSGPCTVEDPQFRRRITVAKAGSADTVVWNPWAAGAAELADLADDEWPLMVCVEAANCLDHRLRLAPGSSHTTGTTIGVEHL